MSVKHHSQTKTLGPRAAQLFTELNERCRSTFTLADVRSITGLSASSARNLVHKAQQRGLVTRLKPGLYNLTMPTSNNPADVRTAFELMEAWA